jgi:CheY-like chemotaxis protein
VRDTGIGLSAAEQAQLFTRFYRASHRAVQEAGGTGLGLTITRSLVEMHGGTITVSSVPGQGSTFTVTLPLVHERSEASPEGTGQRILVVEDETAIGDLLRRYLRRAGYQVTVAATAEEGLRQARALIPGLITLDVYLPDSDGFTLLDRLRHDPATRDIPVLLITVSPDEGHGQLLGAIGHLTKPVDEATVLERVQQILTPEDACIILVADDDPASRQLLVNALRRAGHRTIEASDGAEAIAAGRAAKRLDLALIDVRMPGTDGLAALRALRDDPKTRTLPVVMMTASTGAESSRIDIEALGAMLLTKPLAAAALVDVIASVLDRRVP